MVKTTTIAISSELKKELKSMRIADGETMESIVKRLIARTKGLE